MSTTLALGLLASCFLSSEWSQATTISIYQQGNPVPIENGVVTLAPGPFTVKAEGFSLETETIFAKATHYPMGSQRATKNDLLPNLLFCEGYYRPTVQKKTVDLQLSKSAASALDRFDWLEMNERSEVEIRVPESNNNKPMYISFASNLSSKRIEVSAKNAPNLALGRNARIRCLEPETVLKIQRSAN
jgi:hypothetical protein